MLEKPDIQDQLILSRLKEEYGLRVKQLAFLPLGADVNTAVFRVVTGDGTAYFLKLRKGDFDEISVTLPRFLKGQGIKSIIPPLETLTGELFGNLETYKMILYPFVKGRNGYEVALSDDQWLDFGAALSRIHNVQVPPELARRIPRETYSLRWREMVKEFQEQVEEVTYNDPVAAKVAALLRARRAEIDQMVARGGDLGLALRACSLPTVLCHSDIHAGNLLIRANNRDMHSAVADPALYIVDWDAPIFAPKERDLSQVDGCPAWNDPRQVTLFYQGYCPAEVNRMALAYYRYERIIMDIAEFCKSLLLTDEGGEDREQFYGYFAGQFLPGHEVEIALKTDSQFYSNY
jgi:spectinomycin phosphotransferase